MIFTFSKWQDFCKKLADSGIKSIPAREVFAKEPFLVLKHDVETDVYKARKIAEIEKNYGHKGSYYVQAYLLNDEKNISLLKEMQAMGHEISYHYDVLDASKGDIEIAEKHFEADKNKFEKLGFALTTVCQHGNPIIERTGYHSNRDFFRNSDIQRKYADISDIMVNFKQSKSVEYDYYSDAGRKFKKIYDPINNDISPSENLDVTYKNLDSLYKEILKSNSSIVSIHPHRWTKSALIYIFKTVLFRIIKVIAKTFVKIPFMKKIMSRYYYLAKKI